MLTTEPPVSSTVPARLVTYTRGLDLSGSLEGAGGIGGLLDRADLGVSGPWATTFYHSDGNGNVTLLFDATQTVAARYDYNPYGNTLAASGPLAAANTYRFSSKEVNLASGLYHFGARFYHPNLQRWLNHDPSGFVDGPNLYAYVGNGPTYLSDAWGLYSNLPRSGPDGLGTWSGTPGDSVFNFHAGIPEMWRYPDGVPYVRGVPDLSGYAAEVEPVPSITRRWFKIGDVWHREEYDLVEAELKKKNPNWKKPPGHIWHHFTRNGRYELQLVPEYLHKVVTHKGPVSRLISPSVTVRANNMITHGTALSAVGGLLTLAGTMATVADDQWERFRGHMILFANAKHRGDDLSDTGTSVLADINDIFGDIVAKRFIVRLDYETP